MCLNTDPQANAYTSATLDYAQLKIEELVEKYGTPFSVQLGIDLSSGKNGEIVKWFLASILYGKPIRENSATTTYKSFESNNTSTVEAIVNSTWDRLVRILDEGSYTRYDFSTATKLLEVFQNLKREYKSDLWNLYNASKNSQDLEKRLKSLGKGIGDTTISIFLREMQEVWPKADPKITPLVSLVMEKLKIKDLKTFARRRRLDPIRLQVALLRLGKDFLKKGKTIEIQLNSTE